MEQQLSENHVAIIFSMLDMLDLRDGYTGEHVRHVEDYISLMLAVMEENDEWGLNAKKACIISQAALLHDIGKIAVPDSILRKPGKLTPEEYEIIKTHTVLGADSLEKSMMNFGNNEFLALACEITRFHHERWDGKGYPYGLKGEEIPLCARITAIADVYDALRSLRPYKLPVDRETARNAILEGKGIHFDPLLVEVFLLAEEEFNNYASKNKSMNK